MKLNYTQTQKLMKNWDSSNDSLHCNAEIRVYDPASSFQCYIIAMYPEDENTIYCILQTNKCSQAVATLHTVFALDAMYNENGEGLEIDTEYRPRQASEILKRLNAVEYAS